jgi:hypothetical protein
VKKRGGKEGGEKACMHGFLHYPSKKFVVFVCNDDGAFLLYRRRAYAPFFLCCFGVFAKQSCVSFSLFFSLLSTCPGRHVVGAKPFSRSPRGGREGASRDVTNRSFRPCFGEDRARWPPRNIPSSINAHAKHLVFFFFFTQPWGQGSGAIKGVLA